MKARNCRLVTAVTSAALPACFVKNSTVWVRSSRYDLIVNADAFFSSPRCLRNSARASSMGGNLRTNRRVSEAIPRLRVGLVQRSSGLGRPVGGFRLRTPLGHLFARLLGKNQCIEPGEAALGVRGQGTQGI